MLDLYRMFRNKTCQSKRTYGTWVNWVRYVTSGLHQQYHFSEITLLNRNVTCYSKRYLRSECTCVWFTNIIDQPIISTGIGLDLPRQAWVKLNRLHAGGGCFNADMWRWAYPRVQPATKKADQQTPNHIITECPLYRPLNGLHGLIDVDADAATSEWLLSEFPEIYFFFL